MKGTAVFATAVVQQEQMGSTIFKKLCVICVHINDWSQPSTG